MAPKSKRRKIDPLPSRCRGGEVWLTVEGASKNYPVLIERLYDLKDPSPVTMKAKDAPTTTKPIDARATKKAKDVAPMKTSTVFGTQGSIVDVRIQQARNFAVAQAQKDGCTGNYKIFDSPFGNFLVPVVPSRAELAG